MIICPKCNRRLTEDERSLCCLECNYQARVKSGITIFNPEINSDYQNYKEEYQDHLYNYEQNHFWFLHRKNIILSVFKKFVKKNKKVIEIGAGTGDIMRMLKSHGYKNVSVGDIHLYGLRCAKKYGIKDRYQFDVTKSPFKNHFDVVAAFDVLEHIDNDTLALKKIRRMLKSKGKIIITVPAAEWLWSDIDEQSGHVQRYNMSKLRKLFKKNSLEITYATGFFVITLPLMYIRTLLNKNSSSKSIDNRNGFRINPTINSMLKLCMKLEELMLKKAKCKIGGSIIIVGTKK